MGDRENLEDIRALRELFSNRFTDNEMARLYDRNGRDKRATATHILETESSQLRDELEESDGWTIKSSKRGRIPQDMVDRVRHGFVTTTTRQFACQRCDHSWWRCVPQRKEVSKCNRCKQKYDPLPRDREWGWAEFHCTYCNNNFSGYCQMGQTSPCFNCDYQVLPTRIKASQKDMHRRGKDHRTGLPQRRHQCSACMVNAGRSTTCVHPETRRRNNLPLVVTPSNFHDSTGSTVDTFLPQNDLNQDRYRVFDDDTATLASIPEDEDSSNSDANNK